VIFSAAFGDPIELLQAPYAQRALIVVLLLAVVSAAVGWAIILRDLPFFTHAVGAGAYPVLVLGAILGGSIALTALLGAAAFAVVLSIATGSFGRPGRRSDPGRRDAVVGLVVVAALAIGAVLAQGRGGAAGASPEALLFGSLLAVTGESLAVILVATLVTVLVAWALFGRWLTAGFDPPLAGQAGTAGSEFLLLLVVALAVGAALPVAGSLLAGALLIVPAASVRLFTERANQLPGWTLLLAAVEGTVGLYLSLSFDLPTGATIAAVAGAVFFGAAGLRTLRDSRINGRAIMAPALLAIALFALGGCGGSGQRSATDDSPLRVVATTPQVADIIRQVGGGAVELTTLLPSGADPHDFEPRPSALAALSKADVIFRSGGEIDAWLAPALSSSGTQIKPVDLSRSAVLLKAPGSDAINPHWYLAPANVALAAQKARDELIKADPPARETFRAAADRYLAQVETAGSALKRCAGRLASNQRTLLAGHDDFDYFAEAFGFEIAARLTPTGHGEPSARELQATVDAARKADVRALVASRGEVSQLEREVAKKLSIPLLALYSDNLTTGDDGSTLLGAIGYDVDRIARAVSGGRVSCPQTQ
jgi:ABC-type Zn uptake system ZnuABC Zn-binding protein ZnuA/ABC-type Mn2+/Zn2+ transport system permease subunit